MVQPKLLVVDRDGVINQESPDYIRTPSEWLPLPGSLAAIAALNRAGFEVVVATNQSGVGRGLFTAQMLEAIHRKMIHAVESAGGRLAGIFICPHAPEANCDCRKPRPGLLRQVEAAFGCTLAGQPIVGDSERDIVAAEVVNGRPILVRTGNGRLTEPRLAGHRSLEVFDDLAAVAAALTGRH